MNNFVANYRRGITISVILFILGGILLYMFTLPNSQTVSVPPKDALYLNPHVAIEDRVSDLVSYMTLEEKIGQMTLVEKNSIKSSEDIGKYGIGALLSGFGAKPENNTPEGWRQMISGFHDASKTSRLGIPLLYGVDAVHGHSNVPGATIFPHFIGLGATGNTSLVEKVARATAKEMRATHVNWSYSPTLDIPHDIRWGRTYEAFSDDVGLVSKLGSAYLQGLQNADSENGTSTLFLLGTPKHYIGAGGMIWGSSSNGNFRIDQGTTEPNDEMLMSEYILPFKEVVNNGALSIMVGLNSWGEVKLSAEPHLVTTVLKQELGFKGFAVSDWYGVYEISNNDFLSAVTAINAGIDMVMLPFDYETFSKNMLQAVRQGKISEARINDAVRRILYAKFALGLFDAEQKDVSLDEIGSAENRILAREAVAKSAVLLKNENVLPLKKEGQHIRIAGSAAHNIGMQTGAWTVEWQGIDGNWLPGATSILDGIRARTGKTTRIEFDIQGNFSETDILADIGIAIVGEKPYAEGWGDSEYPVLSNDDLTSIHKLQKTSRQVVVVIVSGRPLLVSNEIETWDAVVAAWLPGSEGSGVADVLFGDVPFTGKLPLPWPHHSEQLPITSTGNTADGTSVLFPRYYGLK